MSKVEIKEIEFNNTLGLHTNVSGIDFQLSPNSLYHFKFYRNTNEVESVLTQVLDRFLLHLDLIFLRESLQATLRETVTNALKANIKRLYFKINKVNMDNNTDYQSSMIHFKKIYLENREEYESQLEKGNYFVVVSFFHNRDFMNIRVLNNVQASKEETAKIQKRLEKAAQYTDLSEAFAEVSDESEGAGLGLIMTCMMLKNDGMGSAPLKFESEENKTAITINVPLKIDQSNMELQKADKIIKEIDQIPTFPKAIQNIQKAIDKPNSSLQDIAKMIKTDVALTANILKLSNSASYRRGNRVESLDRAIQLIGLKELQSLLYSLGTKQILEDKFPAFLAIWEKSNECAFYCKNIAQKMGLGNELLNSLVSMALLHDIGEIILVSLERQKMKSIQKYANSKELSSALSIEEAFFGITHTKIGAIVSEKWEFPETFTKAIEYHHRPLLVEEAYKPFVFPIYLGDMLIKMNNQEAKVSDIPLDILKFCRFNSSSDFQSFRVKMQELYQAKYPDY